MSWKGIVSVGILLLSWELSSRYVVKAPVIFPSFTQVVLSFADPLFLNLLLSNYLKTIYRSTLGFAMGIFLGVFTGILISLKPSLAEYMSPPVTLLFSIPSVAWIPVLIVLIGINEFTLPLAASFMCSYPPVLYGITNALRMLDADVMDVARVYCTKTSTRYKLVVFPLLLTRILPSIKTEAIMVWKTVFVVEMMALPNGLGYLALTYATTLRMPQLVAVILTLSMTLILINALIDATEQRFSKIISKGDV